MSAAPALSAMILPLVQRVRRGEGGLALLCIWFALLRSGELANAVGLAVASCGLLAAMYLYNDVIDSVQDLENPKKNKDLARRFASNRGPWLGLSHALAAVLIGQSWYWGGPEAAGVALTVWIVNVAYSGGLKGVPVADVIVVGLWGALLVAIVESDPQRVALVGAMTMVSHVFQTLDDQKVDAKGGIHTTVVARPQWVPALFCVCCALVAALACLQVATPLLRAATIALAFAPLLLRARLRQPTQAWMATRVAYTLCLGVVVAYRA